MISPVWSSTWITSRRALFALMPAIHEVQSLSTCSSLNLADISTQDLRLWSTLGWLLRIIYLEAAISRVPFVARLLCLYGEPVSKLY
jgi:hypothetical protein